MTTVAERINDYLGKTDRPGTTILVFDGNSIGDGHWFWLATDGYEPIARGGPHDTKRDALEEAHDRCPRWETIRCL